MAKFTLTISIVVPTRVYGHTEIDWTEETMHQMKIITTDHDAS